MISWFKYPFIRLLLPFATGICLASSFTIIPHTEKNIFFLLIFILLSLLLMIISSAFIRNFRYRWIFSVFLNIFLLLSGFSYVRLKNYKLLKNDLTNINFSPESYMARLVDCPLPRDNSVKTRLQILAIEDENSKLHHTDAYIMAYFEKNEKSLSLKYGDCIVFLDEPQLLEKAPNPEQFDYKSYLNRKSVTHQLYLKNDFWLEIDENKANSVYKFSYFIRDFLLDTMKNLGVKGEEYEVAAAIILGYDDTLSDELRTKYVAAGAMHILCVSGLHVGIIFILFSNILAFIRERKPLQKFIKHLILLLLIWFYALLAGLAPSILRATIMLSFVLFANIINRKGVMLNSLAASAFILLLLNPFNILDVGFQLSYAAVTGIVILQKPISKIFYSKYSLINKMWEITSVAIAAQIATIPFTIYFFHQFPAYFWLSNLFMTPISSVVISGGMLMLLVFYIPFLNTLVAFLVSKMIFVMNYIVMKIESLPYSIIKGLYVNDLQFALLLLMLLFLLLFAELKENKMLVALMAFFVLFMSVNLNTNIIRNEQKQMIVYSVNNATAIDFVCGREHVLLTDSVACEDKDLLFYNIENHLISKGLLSNGENVLINDDFTGTFVRKKNNIISFDDKLIAISYENPYFKESLSERIDLDYLILCGRKKQNLNNLRKIYDYDSLIVDASVPSYHYDDLMLQADSLKIECYFVKKDGALIIK